MSIRLPYFFRCIWHLTVGNESPDTVHHSRHDHAPLVVPSHGQDIRRHDGGRDVTDILMAGPQSEDQSSALRSKPIAHDCRVDRSASGLEGSVNQLASQEICATERGIVDNGTGCSINNQEQTQRGTQQASSHDGNGREMISKLARDEGAKGIREHESGVHCSQGQRVHTSCNNKE
jgi:hypothetical protein